MHLEFMGRYYKPLKKGETLFKRVQGFIAGYVYQLLAHIFFYHEPGNYRVTFPRRGTRRCGRGCFVFVSHPFLFQSLLCALLGFWDPFKSA